METEGDAMEETELNQLLERIPDRISDLRRDIDTLWTLTGQEEGSGFQEQISAVLLAFNLVASDLLGVISRLKRGKQ